ncbi:MAG: hypothetical protein WC910_05165 [Bacteroidales bacterium]|jgi:hypothetical protein
MALAITQLDSSASFFKGYSTGIIFAALAGTETDLGDLLTPQWVGSIFQGSTSWTGEAPTMTPHRNEDGNSVYTFASGGSSSLQLDIMSTSDTIVTTFLKGTAIVNASVGAPNWIDGTASESVNAIGWGDQLPVIERPFALVNDLDNQILLFPKALIAAAIVNNDRALHVRLNINAQELPAAMTYLKPVMMVRGLLELGEIEGV